jgi:UDP-galactopyranose mutase
MSRFSPRLRVFCFEEPVAGDGPARLDLRLEDAGVTVAVPHLPRAEAADPEAASHLQRRLLDEFLAAHVSSASVLWYTSPLSIRWTGHLRPRAAVYDCMQDLAALGGGLPPAELEAREAELLRRADLVTTAGPGLFARLRDRHPNVHCFPSSVDLPHFRQARDTVCHCPDQDALPRPRVGYAGPLDERLDLALLGELATLRPAWQFVLVGPRAGAGPLPRAANVHHLGDKPHAEIPRYLSGWDAALLPLRREPGRFVGPTPVAELLAAGLPVVSTSIRDVVRPYAAHGLAQVGDTAAELAAAIEAALATDRAAFRARADHLLEQTSWDSTAEQMLRLVKAVLFARQLADLQAGRRAFGA